MKTLPYATETKRKAVAAPTQRRSAVLALLAALSLAGCEGGEGQAPTRDPQLAASPSVPYSGVAVLPPGGSNPDRLLGMDAPELKSRLGEPTLIRRDGDAEVWQYRSDRCVLDLFLYGAVKRVEHVDLRDRGSGDDQAARECFLRMLRGRRLGS